MTENKQKMAKDEQYHKEYALKLFKQRASVYSYRKSRIAESFSQFYGTWVNKRYNNLLTLHEGETKAEGKGTTPFNHINLDGISPKLNLMLGELRARGLDLGIRAKSADAAKRKKMYKDQLTFQSAMQSMYQQASAETGIDFGVNPNVPKTEEEINEIMKNHRDVYEILMQDAINEFVKENGYIEMRPTLMLDLLCGNEVHAKVVRRNGEIITKRVNPLYCLPGISSEDRFLGDRTAFVEAYYASIPEVIAKYKLKPEVSKKLKEMYESREDYGEFGSSQGAVYPPLVHEEYGSGRVLIIEAEWVENEKVGLKATYDPHDNLHVHKLTGDKLKKAKLSTKEKNDKRNSFDKGETEVLRKCVIVAEEFVIEYGECEYCLRDYAHPSNTMTNYVSVIHSYNNQTSRSLVSKISELQDFKNYCLTLLQKEITTRIGSAIAIDTSKIDPQIYGTGKKASTKALRTLKARNVIFHKGGADARMPGGAVPLSTVDIKSQAVIRDLIETIMWISGEEEKITGINEARQGMLGERTLATTNRMALSQSSMVTDPYYETFTAWEKRFLYKVVMNIGSAWVENPERYENIAANLGIELPENFTIDKESWDVSIKQFPLTKQELVGMIDLALSQGNSIDFDTALELKMLAEENLPLGIKKYLDMSKKMRRERAEAQNAQMQQQVQMNREKQEFDYKKAVDPAKIKAQVDLEKAARSNQTLERINQNTIGQKDRTEISRRMSEMERNNGAR
jgi:hypothetical protein